MRSFISIFIFIFTFSPTLSQEYTDLELLQYLLKQDKNAVETPTPPNSIYRKNTTLYCTGDDPISITNNKGADLMEEGKYEEAITVFSEGLKSAPLFFPYHYNIGKCYRIELDTIPALVHLKKAKQLVPEYYLVYMEFGHLYVTNNHYSDAIDEYKKASKLNDKYLDPYIYIGNIHLKLHRKNQAKQYFLAVLDRDPFHPNALLGKARLEFEDEDYYRSFMTLKEIKIEGEDYDKAYHYYYAECAFKLQNYSTAYEQYKKLLEFKNDIFFKTMSFDLIRHKMELSERFSEQENQLNEMQNEK